ncbi:MAG: hypothetical protein R3330_19485, partial [Saprospiraceae bacterium]|nr:hypothetical protein [Saprospiraceae bacterium]
MVLGDEIAKKIYQHEDSIADVGTGVGPATSNMLHQLYASGEIKVALRYGNTYEFRVRLQDLSGGAPELGSIPVNHTTSDVGDCLFRRFIPPNQPRLLDSSDLINTDTPSAKDRLDLRRPKLGYPAVVYTGKYDHPVDRLMDQALLGVTVDPGDLTKNAEHREGLGIADPDVDRIEIVVEIASLKMDKLDSFSGKEDYVHLFTTTRPFPSANSDDDYESTLGIPVEYVDVKVLHTGDQLDLSTDLGVDVHAGPGITLPTARTIRLTLRAICEDKTNNDKYYGVVDANDPSMDIRFGEPIQIQLYKSSGNEEQLLNKVAGVPMLQGIYMQSDVVHAFDGRFKTLV